MVAIDRIFVMQNNFRVEKSIKDGYKIISFIFQFQSSKAIDEKEFNPKIVTIDNFHPITDFGLDGLIRIILRTL